MLAREHHRSLPETLYSVDGCFLFTGFNEADNKNMFVEFKSLVELEGDIAIFGLVFMGKTG